MKLTRKRYTVLFDTVLRYVVIILSQEELYIGSARSLSKTSLYRGTSKYDHKRQGTPASNRSGWYPPPLYGAGFTILCRGAGFTVLCRAAHRPIRPSTSSPSTLKHKKKITRYAPRTHSNNQQRPRTDNGENNLRG